MGQKKKGKFRTFLDENFLAKKQWLWKTLFLVIPIILVVIACVIVYVKFKPMAGEVVDEEKVIFPFMKEEEAWEKIKNGGIVIGLNWHIESKYGGTGMNRYITGAIWGLGLILIIVMLFFTKYSLISYGLYIGSTGFQLFQTISDHATLNTFGMKAAYLLQKGDAICASLADIIMVYSFVISIIVIVVEVVVGIVKNVKKNKGG